MKPATNLHKPSTIESTRNWAIGIAIGASLFTPIMAKANCTLDDVKFENKYSHITVQGMTSCPNTQFDYALYCDDEYIGTDFTFTDSIGGFKDRGISGSCTGNVTIKYGFSK